MMRDIAESRAGAGALPRVWSSADQKMDRLAQRRSSNFVMAGRRPGHPRLQNV